MNNRHITIPAGFKAAAAACGVKRSGKHDLAVIAADSDASVAIVTTSNQIFGAPIAWDRQVLPKGYGKMRGMVINSGNSNVCTGKQGLRDAKTMATLTAKHLGCKADKVLVASTGVIGRPMPMEKIAAGIDSIAANLNQRSDHNVVEAISTTDTTYKSAVVQLKLGGKSVTVSGIVKGSGMIAPSLATMIGVITTDAAVAPALLNRMLKQAVSTSFNAVTVDSDQSTSDIVAVFASGLSGAKEIKPDTADCKKFLAALREVCDALAFSIAADGEGATRVIEITVTGARNEKEASIAAKSVADSPLVKTAVHGADPNWGRIAMALGKSAAKVLAEKLVIKVGGTKIFAKGTGCKCDLKKISETMKEPVVKIECELGLGKGRFTALTCDLSREYIAINADYTT